MTSDMYSQSHVNARAKTRGKEIDNDTQVSTPVTLLLITTQT